MEGLRLNLTCIQPSGHLEHGGRIGGKDAEGKLKAPFTYLILWLRKRPGLINIFGSELCVSLANNIESQREVRFFLKMFVIPQRIF